MWLQGRRIGTDTEGLKRQDGSCATEINMGGTELLKVATEGSEMGSGWVDRCRGDRRGG